MQQIIPALFLNPATFLMYLGIAVTLWLAASGLHASQGTVVALAQLYDQRTLAIKAAANLVIIITRELLLPLVMEVLTPSQRSIRETSTSTAESDFTGAAVKRGPRSPRLSTTVEESLLFLTSISRFSLVRRWALLAVRALVSPVLLLIPRLLTQNPALMEVALGHDVKTYTLATMCPYWLRSTAHPLVSGTIRTNLCWKNPDATDEELPGQHGCSSSRP